MSPKTEYLIFNISRISCFLTPLKYHEISCESLNCQCLTIEQVQDIKYLKNKLLKYVRIFYMLKSVCNMEILRRIYYALINSKLKYGLSICGCTYHTTLEPLITLQKGFIRIILNNVGAFCTFI